MNAEIEEEVALGNICPACKEKETTLVRINDWGKLTMSETSVCQNKNCSMFVDLLKVKTWRIKNINRNDVRDFKSQNSDQFVKRSRNRIKY